MPDRWENGILVDPEGCTGSSDPYWWDCPDVGGADPTGIKEIEPNSADVDYRPYTLSQGDNCSAFGWEARDFEGRTRRLWNAALSRSLENELWTGDRAQLAAFPNRFLADALTVNDLGEAPGIYALGQLQMEIAAGQTGRGMIHVTMDVLNFFCANDVVHREGNIYLDCADNIVVPGTGYDGSEPDGFVDSTGDTRFIYATGIVQVATSGPRPIGDFDSSVNRDTNDIEWRAEGIVAAWWDDCVHAGIRINLCEPCCSPGS